ncbi:isoleucine--tRNA ligase [Candidatus Woesearchaeota archaeon]|nr:isoleucine--tRNA ligase [Candidatus Woesearchaeota archaeon]MBW3016013.1 isoleucine--tRNA ligase [Candidatus Woesearchaeota archaeon]
MTYDFKVVEPSVLDFWKDNKIYEKAKKKNAGKKIFYYLDGPPYTSGKIHIGHAWGKALRDSVLRYKRMCGFDVWDQPGFDMHGLPVEVAVEKELGIKDKKEILNKLGLSRFIEECQKFALDNLWPMVEEFKRLGVWMDWQNPYMTIKNEYIEGAWWALAKAHERELLYLGKKVMTWCPRCATALAKHELEYENRKEDSIFVKLQVEGKPNEFLIVWTTTPWTIPFNMAVMAHPEFDYVKAKVDGETWILAEALAPGVIGAVAGKKYEVLEKVKGEKLAGTKYMQPFRDEVKFHQENKEERAYSVILSDKYVSTDAGSGLVHCAPGCGPEDFEVGKECGISAFNEIDEHGCFSDVMGSLAGLVAKQDDDRFVQLLKDKGVIIDVVKVDHEYAHCWRCKMPVVFRATDQWFIAVEKLRDDMVERNKKVYWVPDWAGNKWFDSWLKSLQDWCISRQRFWGIPLPIWTCVCGKYKVVSSRAELKKLTGKELDNLHRPWVDKVILKCDCGKDMVRVPDVLDVWLDSGVSPWASLNYPSDDKTFKKMGFPELILEGKDQIRGWFNSLMCMSMVSFGEIPYKAVYMHGFINDSAGRKMSKSLKNIISPYEIIDQYGADTLRYYQIGGAQPGVDLNFNHSDAKVKHRNLIVLWNVQNFVVGLARELKENPVLMDDVVMKSLCGVEERFILSKMNSGVKNVTKLFDEYRLNEIPGFIEDLFLSLSRTYIQMVRDKAAVGEENERKAVLYASFNCLVNTLKLFCPMAPFVCEMMWQNLRKEFKDLEESIHLCSWPKFSDKCIDVELEKQMSKVDVVVQAVLSSREKAKISLRWPVKKVEVVSQDDGLLSALEELEDIIKVQTNCKEIHGHKDFAEIKIKVKANAGPLGKSFGAKSPKILTKLAELPAKDILEQLGKENKFVVKVGKEVFELNKDHIVVEREVPEKYVEVEFPLGIVYLDTERSAELDAEGYAREIMRRVQQLRKEAGMLKTDKASVYVQCESELLEKWQDRIGEKCGASVKVGSAAPVRKHAFSAEEKVKDKTFKIFLDKV